MQSSNQDQVFQSPFSRWDYIYPISFSRGFISIILWAFFALVIIPLFLPTLYIFVWSFFGTETVGTLNPTPTLNWFQRLANDPDWVDSIIYSIQVAFLTSSICCAILIIHFFSMRYFNPFVTRTASVMVLLPAVLPGVIYALALRSFGGTVGLPESFLVLMGHIAFILPLQFFVLEPAQDRVSSNILYAASILGATRVGVLRAVFIPLILRGIISAFGVGFFFSFDEFVVATFVIDSNNHLTVPRKMWDEWQRSMVPYPAVIGVLLFSFYFLVIWVTLIFQNRYSSAMMRRARS